MLRYLAGVVSALLLVGAGVFLFRPSATAEPPVPPAPLALAGQGVDDEEAAELPEATPKTREEKRFARADRDKDGVISREDYLGPRRKAYAKLDTNGDGRLSFEEWAITTTTKFAKADRDKSGTLSPTEFATTAVRRTPRTARCVQPRAEAAD